MKKHPNDKNSPEQLSSNVALMPINPELKKIKPMTYKEIKESNPGEIKYVLFPFLPDPGIAFIYAASGVGKTLFTLNVAYAIAGGGNFL